MTADYVLLHTFQTVNLTTDSGLAEHLCRLLERGCTHEALRTEGGAGDTLQHLGRGCRHSVTNLYRTKVAAFEARILVTQLAG